MNMPNTDWSERIQQFLDGELTAPEVRTLLEAADRDADVGALLTAMKSVQQHLSGQVLETPTAGFTQRVMAGLAHLPSVRHSPRNGLLLLMGVLVACTALMLVFGSALLPAGTIYLKMSDMPLLSLSTEFAVEVKWVINGLILANLLLGLIVLDRTVLRPFFEPRAGDSVY